MPLGLFFFGLVLIVLAWILLSIFPRTRINAHEGESPFAFSEPTKSNEAVIILQPGGRVDYMSAAARSFFDLRENEPYDIERLARRVRPSDDFLDLCATPGSKRVTLGGKLVEISSFEVPGVYPMMLISLRGRDVAPIYDQQVDSSNEVFQIMSEFSQKVASNLDLKTTTRSILEYVDHVIPSDVLELKLWNAEEQKFITFYV